MANQTINQRTNHHGARQNYRSVPMRRHTKDPMKIYYCEYRHTCSPEVNLTQFLMFVPTYENQNLFQTEPIILLGTEPIQNFAKVAKV